MANISSLSLWSKFPRIRESQAHLEVSKVETMGARSISARSWRRTAEEAEGAEAKLRKSKTSAS